MKLMQRVLRWFVIIVAFVFGVAQLKRPARVNLPVDEARALETHVRVTPEVEAMLARSCNDCHSQKTQWPWYTNVAPVSWFVVEHVNDGRRHLDFSDWARYGRRDADQLLEAICEMTRNGSMPMSSYTLMHADARLTAADVQTLCGWTNAERRRLASQCAPPCAPEKTAPSPAPGASIEKTGMRLSTNAKH